MAHPSLGRACVHQHSLLCPWWTHTGEGTVTSTLTDLGAQSKAPLCQNGTLHFGLYTESFPNPNF